MVLQCTTQQAAKAAAFSCTPNACMLHHNLHVWKCGIRALSGSAPGVGQNGACAAACMHIQPKTHACQAATAPMHPRWRAATQPAVVMRLVQHGYVTALGADISSWVASARGGERAQRAAASAKAALAQVGPALLMLPACILYP